ncbi:MAG: glycosyltransferase family 2 protein [Gammaproteobacteria bacterium]
MDQRKLIEADKKTQCLYRFQGLTDKRQHEYSVAILLRTKDRPLCLKRALASIDTQNFKNWQVIIINDGGNQTELEKTIANFKIKHGNKLVVINNPTSLGMSRGLNQGIDISSSEFIAVHDDDDSWHPDFLSETVAFLHTSGNEDCGGVITHSLQIFEEMTQDNIVEKEKRDFNSAINIFPRLNFFRLMTQNTFPPISFLVRRLVVEKIGYFNEDLPVLNDWDFNLRCLLDFEIGVIHKHLANYHMRTNQQNTIYGNSIIATAQLCNRYETVIRNSLFRTALNSEKYADLIGICMALAGQFALSIDSPLKINGIINNQQQTIKWIDQNIRAPLGVDLSNLQTQLNNLNTKVDALLQRQMMVEQ